MFQLSVLWWSQTAQIINTDFLSKALVLTNIWSPAFLLGKQFSKCACLGKIPSCLSFKTIFKTSTVWKKNANSHTATCLIWYLYLVTDPSLKCTCLMYNVIDQFILRDMDCKFTDICLGCSLSGTSQEKWLACFKIYCTCPGGLHGA